MTSSVSKPGDFQRFNHRAIAERQMVIHKIPVDIEAKPDVRPQRNQQPLRDAAPGTPQQDSGQSPALVGRCSKKLLLNTTSTDSEGMDHGWVAS